MKKITLILMIISLSILFGCEGNQDKEQKTESAFLGGDQGLIAEFEPMGVKGSNGINEIWQDETFAIQVILKNKGEYTLNQGDVEVKLKGFDPADYSPQITQTTKVNPNEIEKKSEYLPEGDEDRISFIDNLQYDKSFSGFYDAIIQAEVQSKYKTYLSVPQVCHKYDTRDNTVCKVDEKKNFYVSAAPIQVSDVVEKPGGKGAIYLEISIENKNYGKGRTKRVNDDDYKLEYDRIEFFPGSEDDDDDSIWNCSSGGSSDVARLVEGKGMIRCKTQVNEGDIFTKQFNMELKYHYMENIKSSIRIKENIVD